MYAEIMSQKSGPPDFEAALALFDETVRALEARARRLEEVLTVKQKELSSANERLAEKVHELDSLSHYLELVLSSVASGVVAVNQSGIITTVNPAARTMYAGLGVALEGQDLNQLFSDSPINQILAGANGPLSALRRIPDPQQGERIIDVVASPIIDGSGQVVGAVEVLDDVTDVRRLQEAVERGERLKSLGEMAAGVAHEIRNPLNGIEGFASLLARDLEPDSRSARHAQAIVAGVRDLNRTVSGLLQFTQQRPPQRKPLPLANIISDVHDLVLAELATAGEDEEANSTTNSCTLDCVIADEWADRLIAIDGSQIRHVLLNLIQNAIQACSDRQDAAVRVSLETDSAQNASIAIEDNGEGVPEHLRQEIFTPFFTTKDHGTGLGLAIVHGMIQAHHGSITVESSQALGGAKFIVKLLMNS